MGLSGVRMNLLRGHLSWVWRRLWRLNVPTNVLMLELLYRVRHGEGHIVRSSQRRALALVVECATDEDYAEALRLAEASFRKGRGV